MKDANLKSPVFPTVKEIIQANSMFEQSLYAGGICHMRQASLSEVATNCEKRAIGSNRRFGYKSQVVDYDIAFLIA